MNFVDELNSGAFIQQSVESLLQDAEGKQLLCESLFLYGVMLLVLDMNIPGIVRERLLVSYYRYSTQKQHGYSRIDDVCKLLRSTGFINAATAKRVPNYPEEYFKRIPIDRSFVEMVIGRLRSDDVYNQISIYPLPDHRTTALANQAGMLFVCLYFSADTLNGQTTRMREICDKFFADNWIISIYMGITVNLYHAWQPYKAAKSALENIMTVENVREICTRHAQCFGRIQSQCKHILYEGTINESNFTKNIQKTLNLIRECNVTLRWLMLHTTAAPVFECDATFQLKKYKKLYEQVLTVTGFRQLELFEFLLNISQVELTVREHLERILNDKTNLWTGYRKEAAERLDDIVATFDDKRVKIENFNTLRTWFGEIRREIRALDLSVLEVTGRKIILLIQALDEVQEFHDLNSNLQTKQLLTEACQFLHKMIHIINIKEDSLINLQLIGDLSYAWHIIDGYTGIMQESIKKQPKLVIKLRATFLKLSSALEIPLMRINQSKSDDLISVSQYYSAELVNYVRKVVQIIPETMFEILAVLIEKQTDHIAEIPTRLEKDKLKEYAQLDERFNVARLTYSISVFTEGLLMMKTTLVGVIELDPKQLLEDGIRKELVTHISQALHMGLIFGGATSRIPNELEMKLDELFKVIDGYRRSFEYIQDYLNINGLKIWQEETLRIINYNVEKECNNFLRNKVLDFQSIYQNTTIPIPKYAAVDNQSINFIGRLGREILRKTDPTTTIYLDSKRSWYDYKSHKESINRQIFKRVNDSIGVAGLIGLDKLYSFMIATDTQKMFAALQKNIRDKSWTSVLDELTKELYAKTVFVKNPAVSFANYSMRFAKIWPQFLEWILRIGQTQILLQHIGNELNINCKFNSKNLENTLNIFNDALLLEISRAQQLGDNTKSGYSTSNLTAELNKYLKNIGFYNTFHKIFATTKYSHYITHFLFLFAVSQLPKLHFNKTISALTAKKASSSIDGNPLIVGILTILRQFHKKMTTVFLNHMCQYTMCFANKHLRYVI